MQVHTHGRKHACMHGTSHNIQAMLSHRNTRIANVGLKGFFYNFYGLGYLLTIDEMEVIMRILLTIRNNTVLAMPPNVT